MKVDFKQVRDDIVKHNILLKYVKEENEKHEVRMKYLYQKEMEAREKRSEALIKHECENKKQIEARAEMVQQRLTFLKTSSLKII